jgi:tetrahydromethanopterin S-methyltransferase subunit H
MTGSESTLSKTLLDLPNHQQQYEIGSIRLGGMPGTRATVLIGSIFYHGHKIILDEDRGEFDREGAERLIRLQEDYSRRTGNPSMLDVVGATPQAIERHLEFAGRTTDMPLLIDGTTEDVRRAGLEYVAAAGWAHRAVYNTIQPETSDEELAAVSRAGVQSAVFLTYYMRDFTAQGRLQAVREMLPRAQQAGIRQVLIDTCVLDLATLGQACSAIFDVKQQFGVPAGAGVHNAVAMWRGLEAKMGDQAAKPCIAAAAAAAVAVGADFVLYGPIEDAPYVFPAVALVDTALSQVAIERGTRPGKDHPRFRIG